MLALLLPFALFRLLQGAPLDGGLDSVQSVSDTLSSLVLRELPATGTREVSDIVISCLATVFACTWTAIHPNIPSPQDSSWTALKRRIITTVYALLAPEAVTTWAMAQHAGARRIKREFNEKFVKNPPKHRPLPARMWSSLTEWFIDSPLPEPTEPHQARPWTLTHGFFVQMGGFMLTENGVPIQSLDYETAVPGVPCLKQLLLDNDVDMPVISSDEIFDRSKGDIISKTVVVLQSSWFVAQCIVRWANDLPVTELEVVTLGFALLNALTYALWWWKPQSINVPVYLELKPQNEKSGHARLMSDVTISEMPIVNKCEKEPNALKGTLKGGMTMTNDSRSEHGPTASKVGFIERKFDKLDWTHPINFLTSLLASIYYILILIPLRPLRKLLDPRQDVVSKGALRVPMFHSDTHRLGKESIAMMGIATCFGAVHLIPAWFLFFPSQIERWVWRGAAALIVAWPGVMIVLAGIVYLLPNTTFSGVMLVSPLIVTSPVYIVARIALITVAFTSLRHLPDGAFSTIEWITLIPHL